MYADVYERFETMMKDGMFPSEGGSVLILVHTSGEQNRSSGYRGVIGAMRYEVMTVMHHAFRGVFDGELLQRPYASSYC